MTMSLRQLRQRITIRYHLNPLSAIEVGQYIQHRLQVSGANGAPYFTIRPPCGAFTVTASGIPRLINAICDKCLLAGYVAQTGQNRFPHGAAAPGANWKGKSNYEPDQRRPQTRQPDRTETARATRSVARGHGAGAGRPRLAPFPAAGRDDGSPALLLAGWFFWQWWVVRSDNAVTQVVNVATPPPTIPIAPPPVQAPAPAPKPAAAAPALKPVVVASVAPVAPPARAETGPFRPLPHWPSRKACASPPPAAATPLAAPRGAASPEVPLVSNFSPTPWPVDLKLNAHFL